MPNPPKPINRLGVEITQSEMEADSQSFPGLDQEWTAFAAASAASAPEPVQPQPADEQPSAPNPVPEAEPNQPEPQPAAPRPINFDKIDTSGPIFVEMETYAEFMSEIGRLHVKLHMMDEMLIKMNTLREKEDFELKRWHQSMDDMRRKLLYMDDALFEPGR